MHVNKGACIRLIVMMYMKPFTSEAGLGAHLLVPNRLFGLMENKFVLFYEMLCL